MAVLLLSAPIAAISVRHALRADARLTLHGSAVPGATVLVTGEGFDTGTRVQLTWNGRSEGMPTTDVDGAGEFSTRAQIPRSATPGPHTLGAVTYRGTQVWISSPTASIAITVTEGATAQRPLVDPPRPTPDGGEPEPSALESLPPSPAATSGGQTADAGSADTAEHGASESPSHHDGSSPPAPNPTPAPDHMGGGAAVPTSPDCMGYPEPRVWLEAQSWWLQTPGAGGTDFGHAHVGTCFPYGVAVAGTVVFDVKITMFDNPGTLVGLRPHIATAEGDSINFDQPVLNWRPSNGTGELWQRIAIDTTRVPLDGLQELRMFAQIKEPDGKEMHVSTGWQLDLANGRAERDYREQGLEFTEGRGWYTDVDYTVARFSSVLPATVSGTWTFDVDLKEGAGGIPVTSHSVAVDPNHHEGHPGWIIRQGAGEYVGPISIDTRQLANGMHRLMLRADADASSGSTNSGILVLFFRVQN